MHLIKDGGLTVGRSDDRSLYPACCVYPFQVSGEFPALSFVNYAYICTRKRGNLKETVVLRR